MFCQHTDVLCLWQFVFLNKEQHYDTKIIHINRSWNFKTHIDKWTFVFRVSEDSVCSVITNTSQAQWGVLYSLIGLCHLSVFFEDFCFSHQSMLEIMEIWTSLLHLCKAGSENLDACTALRSIYYVVIVAHNSLVIICFMKQWILAITVLSLI
jgi:hypothetical protein